MEYENIFLNNQIDELVKGYINNNIDIHRIFYRLSKDPNYIEKNFSGYVNEEDMIKLIRKVQKKRKRRWFLEEILNVVDEKSISEKVFQLLVHYPKEKGRKSILILLCHKCLEDTMLYRLCRCNIAFECYYELGEHIYKEEKYSIEDFRNHVNFFFQSPFGKEIPIFLEELTRYDQLVSKDKKEYKCELQKYYLKKRKIKNIPAHFNVF